MEINYGYIVDGGQIEGAAYLETERPNFASAELGQTQPKVPRDDKWRWVTADGEMDIQTWPDAELVIVGFLVR